MPEFLLTDNVTLERVKFCLFQGELCPCLFPAIGG